MIIAKFAAVVIMGYLLGSIPFGVLIGRRSAKVDVREHGSGKTGATNVLRTAGKKAAASVVILDVLKGVLAVVFAGLIVSSDYLVIGNVGFGRLVAQVMAALAAIAGHNWSIFLKFRGGRGVATFFGGLIVLCPVAALFGGEVLIIGETEWNVAEVFRGRIDIELNETGVKQAELLAEYLGDVKVDAIYSSPLKRALKTAEVIASYHKLDVEVAPGLVDFNYGKWQGLPHQEVKAKYRELYGEWIKHPQRVRIPAAESLSEVRERATGVVNSVIAKYGGAVVLVSHRVVNKVLICALLGLDNSHFWNIKQDTCGITTFTYANERFILTEHNNTSYLKPLQKAPLSDF